MFVHDPHNRPEYQDLEPIKKAVLTPSSMASLTLTASRGKITRTANILSKPDNCVSDLQVLSIIQSHLPLPKPYNRDGGGHSV